MAFVWMLLVEHISMAMLWSITYCIKSGFSMSRTPCPRETIRKVFVFVGWGRRSRLNEEKKAERKKEYLIC